MRPQSPFLVRRLLLAAAVAFAARSFGPAEACPFCSVAQQTLSEEVTGADAVVIATLAKPMAEPSLDDAGGPGDPQLSTATFQIEEVLSGADEIGDAKEVNVVYFGDDAPGQRFLITAIKDNELVWVTPLPLSGRAVEYVKQLPALPPAGAERLAFFQKHFEDQDRLLAQDAYDEFSRAPYKDIAEFAPQVDREQILSLIQDPTVGPSSRRLYLTLLGVCGKPEDVAMLEGLLAYDYEQLKPAIAIGLATASISGTPFALGVLDPTIHQEESRKKESLDALLACYLKLKGPAGLKLVNAQFLAPANVEYKYRHAAIMALRFHGEETTDLPREELIKSMRLALDHKDFADQIIPDLTRWQDWEVMDRLVGMFKSSPSNDWIRQPVASYLLVAAEEPGEVGAKAKTALDEIKAIDPETYERAQSFAGFGYFAGARSAASTESSATNTDSSQDPAADAANVDETDLPPDPGAYESDDLENEAATPAEPKSDLLAAAGQETDSPPVEGSLAVASPDKPPNLWLIIGASVAGVIVLVAVFAALLKGSDPHPDESNP